MKIKIALIQQILPAIGYYLCVWNRNHSQDNVKQCSCQCLKVPI